MNEPTVAENDNLEHIEMVSAKESRKLANYLQQNTAHL
jgi:hypothetical protein